ncbi:MAG: glycine--tRNA ligase subunit beta [Spirochaetia bacterium]|nr:glycine--tRNA ligase subunit beta [Spirochaetia bacterium]
MSDEAFLFELYTEEIPSFYQIRAISDWSGKLLKQLKENLLEFSSIETGGTSRRIFAVIYNLKPNQISERKKIKGPPQEMCQKDGKNTPALTGFAKKAGISEEEVSFELWDGKMYATAEINTGGKTIHEVLPVIFENLIKTQAFTRSMRWGTSAITYARPLIQYVAMYGSKVLKFESEFWSMIKSSELPAGHFILGPEKINLNNSLQYIDALNKSGINVKPEERIEKIRKMLNEVAGNDSVIINEQLLDEVNFLVEKPVVIKGSFPHEFLKMPAVVILSEMEEHQKYFGLRSGASETLSNEFLIVANGNPNDAEALENIRKGNEKVLRARLSDGSYFFNEDRKKKLFERVIDLKRMVFHEGMGTIFDKKERIKEISKSLAVYIFPDVNGDKLIRACDLIKADLTTHLVYEFDHLQGEIGSIYAEMDGEEKEIATAIKEHYLPRNEKDGHPESKMGLLLSIADKIDNIIAGHILGKQPTASQDPLGLRRQTLYIIDMLIQNKIDLPLSQIFSQFIKDVYKITEDKKRSALTEEIVKFFKGRMATIFEKEDLDRKFINAALGTDNENMSQLFLILDVLRGFKDDERFIKVVDGFKRMNNIIKDFQTKNTALIPDVVKNIFELNEEKNLHEVILKFNEKRLALSGKSREEYEGVFSYLASIKPDIDHFFDKVMVMHENEKIRMNRLAVLNQAVEYVKNLINIEMLY